MPVRIVKGRIQGKRDGGTVKENGKEQMKAAEGQARFPNPVLGKIDFKVQEDEKKHGNKIHGEENVEEMGNLIISNRNSAYF